MNKPLIICWFSCGTASAVATKLTLERYRDTHSIAVIRMAVKEEHPDNDRFAIDCVHWWQHPDQTIALRSAEEVWKRRRYMAGVKGAPCTSEIKIAERKKIVERLKPEFQVFGYTFDEARRIDRFLENNKGEGPFLFPLFERAMTKQMCHIAIADAGIRLPEMYRLGFENNNCIGCVKANGLGYWSLVAKNFPDVFEKRVQLSREIGCHLLKMNGKRYFLDEVINAGGAAE